MVKTIILVLLLMIAPALTFADTLTLNVQDGKYLLNDKLTFCLDFNKNTPTGVPLEFTRVTSTDANYIKAGILLQQVTDGTLDYLVGQAATWKLINNQESNLPISSVLSYLDRLNLKGISVDVWIPVNNSIQPYLAGSAQVPEPATLTLLGGGLALLAGRLRRKRYS